jgi:predicted transcriptional regulator
MMTATAERRTPPRRSADLTPVGEIMAKDVIAVTPELGIESLQELLLAQGITGAPVVDSHGRPVGIVSKTDILSQRDTPGGDTVKVRDIMTQTKFCVSENDSIATAAGLMAFEGVHRLPVVGARGLVVGVVSPLDVMRWLARQHGYTIANRR